VRNTSPQRRRGFVSIPCVALAAIPALAWPFRLEFFRWWVAVLLFAGLALPIVWLGMRSLSGLGPVRKWVAIGTRLAVVLLFVLVLGGLRWHRQHRNVEVVVLRDVSESTRHVRNYPDQSLQTSIENYLVQLTKDPTKKPGDTIGMIRFQDTALIDAMPDTSLNLYTRAIPKRGSGTNAADAIQLALATMGKDAMHRLMLIWDGNQTAGNLEEALAQATSLGVPVDVMPLRYDVQNEVMVERFVAPAVKRENEPFTIDVILRSTNPVPVTGKLTVMHQGEPMDLDPSTPNLDPTRRVTLNPGLNVQHVRVPAMGVGRGGVRQFRARFDVEGVSAEVPGAPGAATGTAVAAGPDGTPVTPTSIDTVPDNNAAEAFTFVRGKGAVLYVDNVTDNAGGHGPGDTLARALEEEGITLKRITIDQFPSSLVDLTTNDAVILANIPRGTGGISEAQDKMLRAYVHDMGGGLLMLGGEEAFGAGGWQGSEVEKILPVDMDIPAQRQVGKGALVLIMHSCEMPDGNYWGIQCAIKAVETLSEKDEIGILSYGWRGAAGGGGGSQWDYPLADKGDGSRVMAAIKKMALGDMPDFDDAMNVAINGLNGQGGLIRSNARHKHVIIISDGDPQAPSGPVVTAYRNAKISVSTVSVYPHIGGAGANGLIPPTMDQIAKDTGGKSYGPINANPSQLPQIFIKEATIVRRSLIHEDASGLPVRLLDGADDMVKGLGEFEPVFGMVLTSRKNDPKVQMPLTAGKANDPLLAHWQTGLGKAAVFTSDAHNKWGARWVASPAYSKFWAQVVRQIAKPPMSNNFDIQVTQVGDKGKIVVEAMNKDDGFQNFLGIGGGLIAPDLTTRDIRLVQTGPGTYEAEFDAKDPGSYVVSLYAQGRDQSSGGSIVAGLAVNSSPEMRDLKSNEARLRDIATRTGGRFIQPWTTEGVALFTREGLRQTASPLPVWDILIPILLGLILLDVAIRRIAWDWDSTKRLAVATATRVREFTGTRKVETRQTLDALRRVREEVAETKFRTGDGVPTTAGAATSVAGASRPDPKAKFTPAGKGVEGDISKVVGGATDKPVPPPPKKAEPKGLQTGPGGHMGGLMEAKRRAQQAIKQKEQGE
jgi:uncharacterized membrane protein